MKWTQREPEYGDIIRVAVKFYYHYGIFADEKTVIGFGLPDNTGTEPEKIAVMVTDIQTFLSGGSVETAYMSRNEKSKRRSPHDTVAYAMSKVGTCGYNILHNNCEHFVNECVFGEKRSEMVDGIRKQLDDKLGVRKD